MTATRLSADQVGFTATDLLLGRSTAGAGAGEEIACTQAGRDVIAAGNATAQRGVLGCGTIAVQAASAVAITGGTITGMGSPTVSTDVANKAYVDAAVQGIKWKNSVAYASTANVTLASFANGSALDGGTVATGQRVLLKDQTAPAENGIYDVLASGPPTRSLDADSAVELTNATTFAENGTVNADQGWVQTAGPSITVGTTALTWIPLPTALGAVMSVSGTAPIASTGGSTPIISLNNSGVTDAKLRDSAGLSIIGRSTNSTGVVADITAGSDGDVLRRSGTALGFGSIATAGLTNSCVTYAKIQNVSATDMVLGRQTAGAGVVEEIACTASGRALIAGASITAQRTTLGIGTFADEEFPTGTINGINATFVFAHTPLAGSLKVYRGGVRMLGAGVDYTLTTATIVFVAGAIPKSGSIVFGDYRW